MSLDGPDYSVVDLFCGVGGLSHGFVKEGFNVLAGVDSDLSCEYAYSYNNKAKFIHGKIEDIDSINLASIYPEDHKKILIGCAPCQDFSSYNKKKGLVSTKWRLLYRFSEIIDTVNPDIISMENVPDLLKYKGGEVFNDFVGHLRPKYYVTWYIVYCPDYGIPQKRTRLVLFASKYGPINLVPKTHPKHRKTVQQCIGMLPKLAAGEVCPTDPLHMASRLSDMNLKRIRQSKPGGTWEDWDKELIAECHTKPSGQSYDSVYGRMSWTELAPTMTTQCNGYGNGRFGHPEQDRAISIREAAIFQTFPKKYKFVKPKGKYQIGVLARQIGNAVPVRLGVIIARSIKRHLRSVGHEQPVSVES